MEVHYCLFDKTMGYEVGRIRAFDYLGNFLIVPKIFY